MFGEKITAIKRVKQQLGGLQANKQSSK